MSRNAEHLLRLAQGSDKKLYKQFSGIDDVNMIIIALCSGPAFTKNPALRELVEACQNIILNTWVPRDMLHSSRLAEYKLAMEATPPDCRHDLWNGGNAELPIARPSVALRIDIEEFVCPSCDEVSIGEKAFKLHLASVQKEGLECSKCECVAGMVG